MLAFGSMASCASPPSDAGPPNVVLLVVDTLRADHLGTYGHPRGTSSRLDKLASEGALMRAAVASSSWSPPSHTTIVTGREPQHHRVLEWSHAIATEIAPLASLLRRQGYSTALFSSHRSLARGVGRFAEGFDSTLVLGNEQDEEVLRQAADWVRKAEPPYFLQIVLMTPHAPYTKYPSEYDTGLFEDVLPGGTEEFPFVASQYVGEGGIPTSVALESRQDAGYYVNRYDRSIRHADALVSRFLDSARESAGANESTLLVMASDHGESFGEKGSFSHEVYLYDHLLRVPLLFHYPERIHAGLIWSEPVGLTDIVPTILSFAGAPPTSTDGADLSGLLAGDVLPPVDRTFGASYVTGEYQRFMVRRDDYKLIWDARTSTAELYDLVRDPGEDANLLAGAATEGVPRTSQAVFESLQADLTAQLGEYAAALPALTRIQITDDVREELRALGYVD
ncbi:MAG: sulfatase [Gemmatimonadota bacterium]|nr:MAG: sulfatase [Gemmatimonadota bacterium]